MNVGIGQGLSLEVDPGLSTPLAPGPPGNRRISAYWAQVSTAGYQSVLERFESARQRFELNDWGYLLLLHRFAAAVHPGRERDQALLLSKAGYQARVGYEGDDIYLLLPTRQPLYDVTYVSLEDRRFYGVTFDGSKRRMRSVHTYDGRYPDATRVLDLRLQRGPLTPPRLATRVLRFEYDGRDYAIPAQYNEHVVRFLDTYPQMDLAMYSEFEPRRESLEGLLEHLGRAIEGRSELEAANIVLRFVQTAFGSSRNRIARTAPSCTRCWCASCSACEPCSSPSRATSPPRSLYAIPAPPPARSTPRATACSCWPIQPTSTPAWG